MMTAMPGRREHEASGIQAHPSMHTPGSSGISHHSIRPRLRLPGTMLAVTLTCSEGISMGAIPRIIAINALIADATVRMRCDHSHTPHFAGSLELNPPSSPLIAAARSRTA